LVNLKIRQVLVLEMGKIIAHNFDMSPNIVKMIIWRKFGWEGHVARMGEIGNVYRISI
jgi:hypothetical protein